MSTPADPQALLAALSDQLTEESVAEARKRCGIAHMQRGVLTELIKDQPFSVEDIVTVLMSGWVLQSEEIRRLSELEDVCEQQRRAIDEIANQSLRLRALLGVIVPDEETVSPFDILKNVAARVEQGRSSNP